MDRDLVPSGAASTDAPTRWELIRDLAVFQLKLVIDYALVLVVSAVIIIIIISLKKPKRKDHEKP